MEQPYFIIIPSTVRLDKRLSPYSKLLYGEIKTKCNVTGYCWANNSFFSEIIGCEVRSIQRYFKQLEDLGYITVKLTMGKSGTERNIFMNEIGDDNCVTPPVTIQSPPMTIVSPPHDSTDIPPMTDVSQGDDSPVTHIIDNLKKEKKRDNGIKELFPVLIATGGETVLFNPCKEAFLDFYKEKFKTDYYFTAMDGNKLKSILKKIVKKTKEKFSGQKEKFLLEEITPGFDWFYTNAYQNGGNWIQSNFSLKNLDTQFNEIYTTIKDGKKAVTNGQRNGTFGKHPTNEGALEALFRRDK